MSPARLELAATLNAAAELVARGLACGAYVHTPGGDRAARDTLRRLEAARLRLKMAPRHEPTTVLAKIAAAAAHLPRPMGVTR